MAKGQRPIKRKGSPEKAATEDRAVPEQVVPTKISPENNNDKETAYYSALINAWINTKMEKDKSLLALATGGIGLLVTLLTTVGIQSRTGMILCGISLTCFLITIISAVSVFSKNATLILDMLKKNKPRDKFLGFLDTLMFSSFILGIILSIGLGITLSKDRLQKQEEALANEKTTNQQIVNPDDCKSLKDLDKLQPSSGQGGGQGGGQDTSSSSPSSSSNTSKDK